MSPFAYLNIFYYTYLMESLEGILENKYYSSVIILISQIIFIYLRTLNIIYSSERKMLASIITGNGIAITWLISISISINSVIIHFEILPVISYLVGGTIGTYMAIRSEKKKFDNR